MVETGGRGAGAPQVQQGRRHTQVSEESTSRCLGLFIAHGGRSDRSGPSGSSGGSRRRGTGRCIEPEWVVPCIVCLGEVRDEGLDKATHVQVRGKEHLLLGLCPLSPGPATRTLGQARAALAVWGVSIVARGCPRRRWLARARAAIAGPTAGLNRRRSRRVPQVKDDVPGKLGRGGGVEVQDVAGCTGDPKVGLELMATQVNETGHKGVPLGL